MTYKKIFRNNWLTLFFFIILSLVLYFPTISMSFVSDDFLVIRRIALDRILLVKGFFRPLSDLTLYFNYLIGRFNPAGYYLFGIMLHGLNCFLLWMFCKKWKWTANDSLQERYALLAAFLFACYPFHNECIVWILGRASSMASTFGILALAFLVSELSEKFRILLVCICFFIGLTSYESIILLPIMIIVILYKRNLSWHIYIPWILALSATFIIHLIVRINLSGVLTGSYGESFFTVNLIHYLTNLAKVAGRLFLPPIQRTNVFSLLMVIWIGLLILILIYTWRRAVNKSYFLKIITLISIAAILPVMFSVSTKTSESDRFLHFPSFFLCCFISFILVNFFSRIKEFLFTTVLISTYFIFFLEKNNANWIRASDTVKNIIATLEKNEKHQKIFVINLPDEFNGAYIFRLGFKDALLIHGMDTSQIQIVNHMNREEMLWLPNQITPVIEAGETYIPPRVTIRKGISQNEIQRHSDNSIYLYPTTNNTVFYWNNKELVQFQ